MEYIHDHGIALYNARGVYSVPMAEHAVTAALQFFRNSRFFYENAQNHIWQKDRGLRELCGSNVCVIGCGSVGAECAKRFSAMGCKVYGVDVKPYESPFFISVSGLEDMYAYILGVAENLGDPDYRKLCVRVLTDNKEKLMYYPAAAKNHHAEFAGLLFHMKRMLMTGRRICEVYTDLDIDLVSCGVIVHDMEKLNEIESNEYGMSPGYSMEGTLLGHIVMGAKYIEKLGTEIGMPEEKKIMVEHMVVSHHYEPDYGSPKRPMFPEAEVLHYCDILDARLFDMFEALGSAEPGGFSEKVWTLDNRRVYKPSFIKDGDTETEPDGCVPEEDPDDSPDEYDS